VARPYYTPPPRRLISAPDPPPWQQPAFVSGGGGGTDTTIFNRDSWPTFKISSSSGALPESAGAENRSSRPTRGGVVSLFSNRFGKTDRARARSYFAVSTAIALRVNTAVTCSNRQKETYKHVTEIRSTNALVVATI